MHRPTLVVISPIAPAATGNGLAMRAHALVTAAAIDHRVALVVVPVAGWLPAPPPRLPSTVVRFDLALTERGDSSPVRAWLADPLWRHRLAELAPIPDEVAAAPPTRAHEIVAAVAGHDPTGGEVDEVVGVVALRLALAPLALKVSELLDVTLVVDADDDDVDYHRGRGEDEVAERWARVAALCLPKAGLVLAASGDDAGAIARRWSLGDRVVVAPNAVTRPTRPIPPPPGRHHLLFVANFTYAPNEDGARWFVGEVMPLLSPRWSLTLVGSAPPSVVALGGDRVEVTGWVADVDGWYDEADVVVAPIRFGSGTRIKALEAFARRRPLVSTSVGIAGIGAVDGVHALVADDPPSTAAAIESMADSERVRPLVEAAHHLVVDAYDAPVVNGRLASHLRGATRPSETI